jgi:RHS repeat-associated protein
VWHHLARPGFGFDAAGYLSQVQDSDGNLVTMTNDIHGNVLTRTRRYLVEPADSGTGQGAGPGSVEGPRAATATSSSCTATGAPCDAIGRSTDYSYDPSAGLVAAKPDSGTAEAALTDVHGDVTGLFSPAPGTTSLAASAAYSPYGTVTATSGSMPSLGYQGQYTDPSTGDTDMSARWYSPATGTFTSNDTLTGMPMPSSINPSPYGYAGDDPLTNEDLSGHCGGWVNDLCLLAAGVYGTLAFIAQLGASVGEYSDYAAGGAAFCELLFAYCGAAIIGFLIGINLDSSWDVGINQAQNFYGWLQQLTQPGGEGGGYDEGCLSGSCEPTLNMPWLYGYDELNLSLSLSNFGYYAPPPPPPQDCYAGPDPSCSPPPAPRWLRYTPYETQHPANITSPADIARQDWIIEPTPTEQQMLAELHLQTTGITAQPGENGAFAASQDASTSPLAEDPISDVGIPATPDAPNPESATSPAEGGGSHPTVAPAIPEPPQPVPGGGITRVTLGIPAVAQPTSAGGFGVPVPFGDVLAHAGRGLARPISCISPARRAPSPSYCLR